jgi:hypothetical protein
LAGAALAGTPIYEPLLRTESVHFIYITQKSLAHLLPELIRDCEDAQALLAPAFRLAPPRKTVVLFLDHVDASNGSATVYPRSVIRLLAVAPFPKSTLYEPGPWRRRMVIHEYAHILTLEARPGWNRVLSGLFGRVLPGSGDPVSLLLTAFTAPPCAYGPDWFVEGVATWAETEYTAGGRGRNSYSDMVLRLAALEDRTPEPSQWSLAYPAWPYGRTPYLYGMRAMQTAQAGAGDDRAIPGDLADSGARAWPYLFGDRAVPVIGRSLRTLAGEVKAREAMFQVRRAEVLRATSLTETPRLTPPGLEVESPVFSTDGRTVYMIGHREGERDAIRAFDLDRGTIRALTAARVEYGTGSRLAAPTQDGRLLYTRLDVVGRDRLWNHLLTLDLADESTTSLTSLGRYHYPAARADGLRLVAVSFMQGVQRLVEMPLAGAGARESERLLVLAEPGQVLLDPAYSPDGRWLVYVASGPDGSALHRIDLTTGRNIRLFAWPGVVAGPVVHPSGREVVFAADANGVYNLYRLDLARPGEPTPLTHVLGGLFEPAFSPDGARLAAVAYDAQGPYLTVLDYAGLIRNPPGRPLPVIRPDWNVLPATRSALESFDHKASEPAPAAFPYRSWREVGLDYWTPWLTYGDYDVEGGLAASFSDPAERQSLAMMVGAESRFQTLEGSATYRYGGWYAIPELFGSVRPRAYPGLVMDAKDRRADYREQAGTLGAAVTIPWLTVDRSLALTLGYRYSDVRELTDSGRPAGGGLAAAAPYEGGEGAVFAGAAWDTTTTFRESCSREDGRLVRLTVERGAAWLGGNLDRTRGRGTWREYVSLPWARNHVLKMTLDGGSGWGDDTAQGSFGLGGFGDTVDTGQPGVDRRVALRGYPENEQVGDQAFKAGAAYRFPIWRINRAAHNASPLVFHQVFGEVFYEGGRTWNGNSDQGGDRSWIQAAGLEANADVNLARWVRIAPGVGAAYAFDRDDGSSRVRTYISLKATADF